MRTLTAITHTSLDGVMQSAHDPEEDQSHGFTRGGWALPFVSDEGRRIVLGTISGEFDLLLGRRTYDLWSAAWGKQNDHPIGKAFNKATKYVVTHRPDSLNWKPSQPITGDVVSEVRRLKASAGPALQLWGSSEVLHALFASGLIDEHRMFVFPVVVGAGKRLFENAEMPRAFALVSSQSTPTGVLFNTYRVTGPIGAAR